MNKALLVLLIILLQIGTVSAGIAVRNATTVWNANASVPGVSPIIPERIVVEYANIIYLLNLTSILSPPNIPDRILIDHANAVYNPYLIATPSDFKPIVPPRIVVRSANNLWNPVLSLTGIAFIDIKNSAFNKNVITIPVNTTVTWINFDSIIHTVTADGGSFNSGNLSRNQSFSFTFKVPGTYAYHCNQHPSMKGSIIVTAPPWVDTTPPRSITNLTNKSYKPYYINWTWTDPKDSDFARVMVYINGVFKSNVTKGVRYYNAAGLSASTGYTISTHTVDTSGNINKTWMNHTARTAPPPPGCGNASTIYGYTFNDTNGNRTKDAGEVGLSSWTINMKGFDTCARVLVNKVAKTNATGYFAFSGIYPGAYVVSEDFVIDWLPTTDAAYTLNVTSKSMSIRRDFGNRRFIK